MRKIKLLSLTCLTLATLLATPLMGQERTIVIRAGLLLDGKGAIQRNVNIVVQGSRIMRINTQAGAPNYDLRTLTVLPGLIDTHVHITGHFGKDGHASNRVETPEQQAYFTAENAYVTLMAGLTTVQSVGAAGDVPLREAVDRAIIPGPRILTSIRPVNENTGPDQLRKAVCKLKAQGADVIKIFRNIAGLAPFPLDPLADWSGRNG